MKQYEQKNKKKGAETASDIMIKTVRQESLLSLGILVTVIGAVVVSLLPPLALGRIIDQIAGGAQISVVWFLGYFLLLVMMGLLESARESFLTVFGQKMTHAFRSRLSEKLMKLDTNTLNREEPGTVVSRIVGDVDTVEALFTSGIISMFADACRIVSIFAVIWFRNRGLGLLLLILVPVIFKFTRVVQKRMLEAQLKNREAVSRVTNHVPETIRCIRTIHTLGKEAYMERRYDEYIGESYAATEKMNFYDAVYSPVILFLNAVTVAVVMLLAASKDARMLTLFGMSVGTSVTVINYIAQIFSPIESLGMEIQTIQSAVAGVHRINEFLAKPEREDAPSTEMHQKSRIENSERKPAETICPCVEFQHVTFGYDERTVLKNLSFSIKHGEQVTLIGRTGAGKSTIFKLMLGLYLPKSGAVLIDGVPAHEIAASQKRAVFGYVEQSFHMVSGTVRDQIALFDSKIQEGDVVRAAKLVGLHETIQKLEQGYDTPCRPEVFSQGQWQLLSIARAVAGEPRILLLDEITANLDAETEELVLEALKNAAMGRTVISISHRVYQKSSDRGVRYLEIGFTN